MNMRYTNHVNTCILWLRTFIKNITGYTSRTCFTARSKELQEKPSEIQFNSEDVFRDMLV
jgi:hypothetical protein